MPKNKRLSVYWFDPEPTVGSELRKVRPCIVISPEEMNQVVQTVLIIPLTPTSKSWPFRVTVKVMGRPSVAACDQLRTVDKSRLKSYIDDLSLADSDNLLTMLQTIFSR